MENIKPSIFQSPIEASTYLNFCINSENLVANPTETDDLLYIYKNEDSVPLSQECLPANKTSIEEKDDYSFNNLNCMESPSSSVQGPSGTSISLSSPTCKTKNHLGSLDELDSTSSISSVSETQSKHEDMPKVKTKKQTKKKLRKRQTSNCSIDDEKEVIACPYCQKEFHRRSSLKMHIKLHMSDSPQYTCPASNCGRIFNQKGNLKRHLYGYEKKAVCSSCNRTFLCRTSWTAHLKNHVDCKTKQHENSNLDSQILNNSIPATTTETNLSFARLGNGEPLSDNPDYTVHASVDTFKAQSGRRDSFPTMSIATALLSLNDMPHDATITH